MCKKLVAILSLQLFLLYFTSFAGNYLYVSDPRGWGSIQGTIEAALVSVKPKGIYTEVGLYLTFSARDWYYNASDSLEVQFYFDLPENSIVTDSWLWVEEDIIRGKIMDKWTASAIYEDIVKRRRDPSILFKTGKTSYNLRIFPMVASQKRKVKITYLVPTQWTANNVLTSLPTGLLTASRYPVSPFYLLTWLNEEWKNPEILEFPGINFQNLSDSAFGNYIRADIPSEAVNGPLNFSVDSPMINGLYFNYFKKGNEGTYQMALLPGKALNISAPTKLSVLIDYTSSNSTIQKADILNQVRVQLHSSLTEKDSFNVILSNLTISRLSEKWMKADSATIETVFSGLNAGSFANYSNLPALLSNGIDFIKKTGNDGSILLISNDKQVGSYQAANQLMADLMNLMPSKIPIHIADYNESYSYQYIGGRYYYGNEYFYTNLSRQTGGNFFRKDYNNTFQGLLGSTFGVISGFINSFDLHTDVENGYCYSRYSLTGQNKTGFLNQTIMEIGKFRGDLPFTAEVSGSMESQVFSQSLSVNENQAVLADSLSEEAWAGNQIQFLEALPQTNNIVSEIVDLSIKERVLSVYSAYLCLEPSRGGEVCYDCMDESGLVSVEDNPAPENGDSLISAYPNPFNNQVSIRITLPESMVMENFSAKIYNVLGQVVYTYQFNRSSRENNLQLTWTGLNDSGSSMASGVYFFVIDLPGKRYSHRLMLLK
ncbi:MAG: T9SS type A sorting domain-containing protein [Bacteroidetes bacterium]|nr:T9SS type A sorting domain-containing protein [Bacteroidota bacterium]